MLSPPSPSYMVSYLSIQAYPSVSKRISKRIYPSVYPSVSKRSSLLRPIHHYVLRLRQTLTHSRVYTIISHVTGVEDLVPKCPSGLHAGTGSQAPRGHPMMLRLNPSLGLPSLGLPPACTSFKPQLGTLGTPPGLYFV